MALSAAERRYRSAHAALVKLYKDLDAGKARTRAERRTINEEYREAEAALQAEQLPAAGAQAIVPKGVASRARAGRVS